MVSWKALASHRLTLFLIIAAGLRLALIPNPGFEADVSFWKSWGLATVDHGIVGGMKLTNNNYPTPFAYTLGGLVWIYRIFADPHIFNEFWKDTNILFLAVSKALPITADFGIAALILYIGKSVRDKKYRLGFPDIPITVFGLPFYELLAVLYLLSPVALIDGAWWGQVDSLGLVIFLGSIVLLLKRMPLLAGFVFMVSMMTKLQNMIYGPLFFLFAWQHLGYSGLIRTIFGAFGGFIGLNIEFLLTSNADRVIGSLTDNYDYFPWMSLHAHNLWWIVTGGKGMITSDKLTVIGLLNAKSVGLVLFSSMYLFGVIRQLFDDGSRKMPSAETMDPLLQRFLESLIVVNAAFFLFQTQSHDRYAFPLSVFLLLWAPFYVARHKASVMAFAWKMFAAAYLVYTVFYFYNLHTALAVNYPQNAIPVLSGITGAGPTVFTAFVLLALFGLYLMTLVRSSRHALYSLLVSGVIIVSGLLLPNIPLISKKSVPLTRITPYISEQSYGTRQTDRTVQSGFGGPYQWNRLSVQYLFYAHGIGSHADSRFVYDLNRKFRRFTTDFGVDTESGTKSSVMFEIYGDGRLLFRSVKMGRFDLPKHADVAVSGVKFLTLKITDAGDGNYDDHADWLNPVLWP